MYLLSLNIKIHSVTCPGVWLCPKGETMMKIHTLQYSNKTRRIHPKFPLNFGEKLSFQKFVIGGVKSIADILEKEEIEIDLIQWTVFNSKWGVVLAKFSQYLRNIFDSFIIDERVSISSKADLLMSRTEYFPGIISPKINATFELLIESYNSSGRMIPSLSSTNCNESQILRQQRVCHSRSSYPHKCSLCSACDKFWDYQEPERPITSYSYGPRKCYANETNSSFCSWCDYIDIAPCKCRCCLKYHILFH